MKINFVAKNPHDQNMFSRDQINDGVTGVVMDADRWVKLRPLRGHQGSLGDKGDRPEEALFISISLFDPEPLYPIPKTVRDVGFGLDREPNLHGE